MVLELVPPKTKPRMMMRTRAAAPPMRILMMAEESRRSSLLAFADLLDSVEILLR